MFGLPIHAISHQPLADLSTVGDDRHGRERCSPPEPSPRIPEVEQAIADMKIDLVGILDQAEAEFRDEVRWVKARVAALEDTGEGE